MADMELKGLGFTLNGFGFTLVWPFFTSIPVHPFGMQMFLLFHYILKPKTVFVVDANAAAAAAVYGQS